MSDNYSSRELNIVYQALANETRRDILTRLVQQNCSITELAEPYDMSLAAISKHIKVLEKAGLIVKEKEGTTHRCRIRLEPLQSAASLIKYFELYIKFTPSARRKFG